jgi:hypothetical protein
MTRALCRSTSRTTGAHAAWGSAEDDVGGWRKLRIGRPELRGPRTLEERIHSTRVGRDTAPRTGTEVDGRMTHQELQQLDTHVAGRTEHGDARQA